MYGTLLVKAGLFFVGLIALEVGKRLYSNAHKGYRNELKAPAKAEAKGVVGFYNRGLK